MTAASIPLVFSPLAFSQKSSTNHIYSLLVEIKHALENFHQQGIKQSIDLLATPLSAFERKRLLGLLGKGEVDINLTSLGKSEIYETNYNGIWFINHKDEDNQVLTQLIEITQIPDIVLSPIKDIPESTKKLQTLIENEVK